MNAVEHLVKAYFEVHLRCFTLSDVKVPQGNNRQCDLLAVKMPEALLYHVEPSVAHPEAWWPTPDQVRELFERKFFGRPGDRPDGNPRTDAAKGKSYYEPIQDVYRSFGFDPLKVVRVMCVWTVKHPKGSSKAEQGRSEDQMLGQLAKDHGLPRGNLQILSFRDQVLKTLRETAGTANYDDVVLRTFSLLVQAEKQAGPPPGPEPSEDNGTARDLDTILHRLVKLKVKKRLPAVNSIKAMFQFDQPITDERAGQILEELRERGSLAIDAKDGIQFRG